MSIPLPPWWPARAWLGFSLHSEDEPPTDSQSRGVSRKPTPIPSSPDEPGIDVRHEGV